MRPVTAAGLRPLILHLGDNAAACSALSQLLRQAGFQVLDAATAEQALALACEKPDLLLLDVQPSPGLDGLDVYRRLKADPRTASIPVLLISGHGMDIEKRVGGWDSGADCYLTKPFEPAELLAQIRALLRLRRAEAERDVLLRRMQLQIDRMPLAYVHFDAEFRLADWNPAAERTFGYALQEVRGMGPPFEKFVPPSAWPRVYELIPRIQAGDMSAHSVNENVTKDGRIITCEWFNTPLLEGGRFVGLMCLTQDITGRKALEEQLRHAQRMEVFGQLAGGVAHDFNNLLTVINGYSNILLGRVSPEDPAHELVREILRAGQQAASLTQQLLACSRRQVPAPKVLDLNAAVMEMEKILRWTIGEDIRLATWLRPDIGRVLADPGQLEQVLLNLVVNARDAMPQGGHLIIATDNVDLDEAYGRDHGEVRPGPYVVLAVTDTGHGMAKEVKARIFEPFFTTKPPGKGTGLGLATVHGIIKQSGGHVAVDSEPGCGTTFKVYLPRVEERDGSSQAPVAR